MKLRILDNSLRLRLDRRDLLELLREGRAERNIDFGQSVLIYALHAVPQVSLIRATLCSNRIDVYVDAKRAGSWARSDAASLVDTQRSGAKELTLLVEKDFPCHHSGVQDSQEKFTPDSMNVEVGTAASVNSGIPLRS